MLSIEPTQRMEAALRAVAASSEVPHHLREQAMNALEIFDEIEVNRIASEDLIESTARRYAGTDITFDTLPLVDVDCHGLRIAAWVRAVG